MPEERQEIKDEQTLKEVISGILKEKEPELYNSYIYRTSSFEYCKSYVLDKSKQEVRRELANAYVEFHTANDDKEDIALSIFLPFSTEEERKTPIDEEGNVYCADLDITINPREIYNDFMEKGKFWWASRVADEYGLGKEKYNPPMMKWIEEQIRTGEHITMSHFGSDYYTLQRIGELDTPLGKEVAQKYYDSLLETGKYHCMLNWFDDAKQVAQEAGLGQDLVEKAEREKPGILRRIGSIIWEKLEDMYYGRVR